MYTLSFILWLSLVSTVWCGLGGPFVLWGPGELSLYRRPALQPLEQDDLVDIFGSQAAIVVFNNQDALPLSQDSDSFPRLRKLLERKTSLVLPQDYLDVHPEYINNETQVITVQGPNSERDAEITETFDRLEDIYGEGKVLGIMGSWTGEEEKLRLRRDVETETTSEESEESKDKPKEAPYEVVYNASGKIVLYATDYPVLRYLEPDNKTITEVKLRHLVETQSDHRGQQQYSRLIVSFSEGEQKFILRFRFPEDGGYWMVGSVEFTDPRGVEYILTPKQVGDFMGAPKGFSFKCSLPLHFQNGSVSLTLHDIQVQAGMQGSKGFGLAYNCVGFMTVPIWSGLLIASLIIGGTFLGIMMIADIKTMDKFENAKGKVLTFTVME